MRVELTEKVTFRSPFFLKLLICLLLAISIFIVYWQVKSFNFLYYDDPDYVVSNHFIERGINLESIKWAFSSVGYSSNWHPMTWISHMLDIQFFGMNPGMHHLVNVIFHLLNTILLFIVLEKMTGAIWKSAAVAALFALHPLHVESVAWISERKDLLSAFFWILTMLSYYWYVQKCNIWRYLIVILIYILGLLSKPMLVTLPFVLLLLDFWPLKRLDLLHSGDFGKNNKSNESYVISWLKIPNLIIEKIPMIVLAIISSYITIIAQRKGLSFVPLKILPLSDRILNAIYSYVAYLWMMIWPVKLMLFHLYLKTYNSFIMILFFLLLILITIFVMLFAKKFPYFLVGWLWYIGTLIPVIGIVQVGPQSLADRYTYIPLIGIFIFIVWGINELINKWRCKKMITITLAVVIIPILIFLSWIQTGYWINTVTLFEHTITVTVDKADKAKAHYYLAAMLMNHNVLDSAEKHCSEALRITPNDKYMNYLMGQIFKSKGDISKAMSYYTKATQIDPTYYDAYNSLGVAFMYQKRFSEAIKMFSKTLEIRSDYLAATVNMGISLEIQGRDNEAIHYLNNVLQIRPDIWVVHYYLGNALLSQGKIDEAIEQYRNVLKKDPNYQDAQQKLIKLLANGDRFKDTNSINILH